MPNTPDLTTVLTRLTEVLEATSGIAPEGLAAADAGRFAGVSVSKWHDLNSRGLCPSPVEIGDGRCPRWLRSELLAWMRAGCPARATWNLTRPRDLQRRAG